MMRTVRTSVLLTLVVATSTGCTFVLGVGDFRVGSADGGASLFDAGSRDAGGPRDAGTDACVASANETCNGADDDCDGNIDEGSLAALGCGGVACTQGQCLRVEQLATGSLHSCALLSNYIRRKFLREIVQVGAMKFSASAVSSLCPLVV